jgi:hypothetical protein
VLLQPTFADRAVLPGRRTLYALSFRHALPAVFLFAKLPSILRGVPGTILRAMIGVSHRMDFECSYAQNKPMP